MDQKQYFEERLIDQINWYDAKCRHSKKSFITLRVIEISCAAFIPLLAGIGDLLPHNGIITGLLGAAIAICAGISSLNRFQEKWIEYRTICETLKQQKFLFLTGTSPYDSSDAFEKLVTGVENLLSKETANWSMTNKNVAGQMTVPLTAAPAGE